MTPTEHAHPQAGIQSARVSAVDYRRGLFLYFLSELLLSVGIGLGNYAQPFLYASGGMRDAQIGVLFATSSLTAGLAALLLGPLCDRVGASRAWKWATLGMGLGYLSTAVGHTFAAWWLAAVFSGVAGGLLMATENVVLSSLTPTDNKASVLSRFVAFYSFAIALGMALGGWLSAAHGYAWTMTAAAVVALASPCIRWFVKAPDAIAKRAFRLPSLRLVAMGTYSFGMGAAFGLFTPFATLVLKNQFGLPDHIVSTISAVSLLSVSVGSFLVSHAVRRWSSQMVLTASFALAAGATLALTGAGNAILFTAFYLLRSAFAQAGGPVVDAAFLERTPPTMHSQMFGLRVFANTIGSAAGSSSAGALLQDGRLAWSLCLSALMFGLTWLYLRWLLARLGSGTSQTSV